MGISRINTAGMELLAVGTGNWDYYLSTNLEKGKISHSKTRETLVRNVYYIHKSTCKGCSDGWFGNTEHFRGVYLRTKNCSLTALGEKVVYNL